MAKKQTSKAKTTGWKFDIDALIERLHDKQEEITNQVDEIDNVIENIELAVYDLELAVDEAEGLL